MKGWAYIIHKFIFCDVITFFLLFHLSFPFLYIIHDLGWKTKEIENKNNLKRLHASEI